MAFEFEVVATDGLARAGILHTPHGDIPTPVFAPVGTAATVKAVPPRDLEALQVPLILANTYHLFLRPGDELVRQLGGLHSFMRWDGPILTDSGGFQVFSLSEINRIDADGVTFRSHLDGSMKRLTPARSIEIQQNLGTDIIMALDQCPPPSDRAEVEAAVARTHDWLLQCRQAHPQDDQQALFGIVQGGVFPDLREQSARFVSGLDLRGYAIGGLAVGETKRDMQTTLERTLPILPADKPRYLMGVGEPDDLVEGVLRGVDMFDCVIPTRLARHGAAFTHDGRINLRNAQYKLQEKPIDAALDNYASRFSRAYLRHLVVAKELLAHYLLSLHNIDFLVSLVAQMRQAIIEGRLREFAAQFLPRYLGLA
ncbi:MAG: tRNA guanosine(34) transglycosylase Tgt [Chloroflexi bacterium]|nr:tRNA guanosine(34) transglycosylase Tgt [Chloroflexota bacterium]MCY4248557.1 tRNA guanosine(34) transglycosylase Tgt [Chloroflexota bacterium]